MSEPKIVKYVTDSTGVELWVQPVSPFTFRAIRQKARELFPDPDETPYRQPIPNAALAGETTSAWDNPAYIRLAAEAERQRSSYVTNAIIVLACDRTPNKAELAAQFRDQLLTLQKWMTLPEDGWEAALLHCVLIGQDEPQIISDLASEKLPLTPEEVEAGIARFFRPDLQRETASELVRPAPGLQ